MRTVDEQHTMLELAIEAVEGASTGDDLPLALRNQQVQALTAIALELRELREQGLTPAVPPCADLDVGHLWGAAWPNGLQICERCNLVWPTHVERVEGSPHGTARDSADAQFDD